MGEHKREGKAKHYYRKHSVKGLTGFIIIILGAICVWGVNKFYLSDAMYALQFTPSRTLGDSKSPFKIIEYADFQCSHCADGLKVLKDYMKQYPGQIQVTFKHYPLGELNSMMSAIYAQCASRQGKFWEYTDILFERRQDWRTMLKIKPIFDTYAEELKLDSVQLKSCVEDKSTTKLIESEKAAAEKRFVKSTPTYFINGEMVVGVPNLKKSLDKLLNQKK